MDASRRMVPTTPTGWFFDAAAGDDAGTIRRRLSTDGADDADCFSDAAAGDDADTLRRYFPTDGADDAETISTTLSDLV